MPKSKLALVIDFDQTICGVDSVFSFLEEFYPKKALSFSLEHFKKEGKARREKESRKKMGANQSPETIDIDDDPDCELYFESLIASKLLKTEKMKKFAVKVYEDYISYEAKDIVSAIRDSKSCEVFIVSGGLRPLIQYSADKLGVKLYCRDCIVKDGTVIGIKNNGFNKTKTLGLKKVGITDSHDIINVGDGLNDYELIRSGASNCYIHYNRYSDPSEFFYKSSLKKMNSLGMVWNYLVKEGYIKLPK